MDLPDTITTRRAVLGGIGTLAAGGGVVYGASQLDSESSASTTGQFQQSSKTTGFDINLQGHPIMGDLDAPIDMYYWSDYQCPFCRRFEQNAFPKIIENYVKTGTVRVVFIEFPYLSDNSMTAAVMDKCVWRQVRDSSPDTYLRWHSTLYDEQESKGSGWASKSNLLEITRGVEGVDASAVKTCMENHRSEIESSINEDMNKASQFGIRGTPAFILYNRDADAAGKLVGAQPYGRFKEAFKQVQNAG
ncbi:DsbA family protein [Halorussus halophilus]|uniref:DsbA family protein n=1 Tax=Halorussus halophilus TaxID=2650975 RepID=UPI001CE3F50D|nr:thioredoxin domain-containing protein [Halorussus halophilus]